MALNLLRRVRKKVTDHVLDYAEHTVLHGIYYFMNRGTIKGGTKGEILIKMPRFDRLVDFVFTSSFTNIKPAPKTARPGVIKPVDRIKI